MHTTTDRPEDGMMMKPKRKGSRVGIYDRESFCIGGPKILPENEADANPHTALPIQLRAQSSPDEAKTRLLIMYPRATGKYNTKKRAKRLDSMLTINKLGSSGQLENSGLLMGNWNRNLPDDEIFIAESSPERCGLPR